jgi:hypothetical protein
VTFTVEHEIAAKDVASTAWYQYTKSHSLDALVPGWRVSTAPDGAPRLTVEVVGPDAEQALRGFAHEAFLILTAPDDTRPVMDTTVPGRIGCWWRTGGVWVEIWHPDTTAAPAELPVRRPRLRNHRFYRRPAEES